MSKKTQTVVLVIITLSLSSNSLGDDCECSCRQLPNRNAGDVAICDFLENLNNAVEANKGDLIKWNRHFSFVKKFSENWKEEIEAVLQEKMENKAGRKNGGQSRRPGSKGENQLEITETAVVNQRKEITPEERLSAVESRTVSLEKELGQEKKVRRQLESNLARIQKTLIAVTHQILNLTSSMDVVMNLFYSKYPSFANALNERLNFFVEQMNAGLENLYKIQAEKVNWNSDKILQGEPLTDERDIVEFNSRLDKVEEKMKEHDSSIAEILQKLRPTSRSPKQRKKWYKPSKNKKIWDDY